MEIDGRKKDIVLKTTTIQLVDKFAYGKAFDIKETVMDLAVMAGNEYFLKERVAQFFDGPLSSLPQDKKEMVQNILVTVGTDQLMRMVMAHRPRSLMESVVAFTVSELAVELTQQRFPRLG